MKIGLKIDLSVRGDQGEKNLIFLSYYLGQKCPGLNKVMRHTSYVLSSAGFLQVHYQILRTKYSYFTVQVLVRVLRKGAGRHHNSKCSFPKVILRVSGGHFMSTLNGGMPRNN